jgi:mycothiol synthase
MTSPQAELTLREVGIDDITEILALTNACDIADTGEVDLEHADVAAGLTDPGARAWSLVASDGTHKACAWLEPQPNRPSQSAEFFVHPSLDPEVGAPVLAAVLAAQRDDPAGRKLHVMVSANAPAKAAVLQARGAQVVRHFFNMTIVLTDEIASATWPETAQLRGIDDVDDDLRAVHLVLSEAFEDHWEHASTDFDTWQERHRKRGDYDPSLWWLVTIDGEPAAALVGANRDGGGFVAVLGVRRPYRGLGLARSLLLTSFAAFRRRGCERASLYVDSTNPTGAVRVYESVGMSVAAQWDCHEFPATS